MVYVSNHFPTRSFAEAANATMASLFLFPFNSLLPRSFLSNPQKNHLFFSFFIFFDLAADMKLAANFNSKFLRLSHKRIFRFKFKKAPVSRSDPSSFSSNASSSSSSSDGSYDNLKAGPSATPISVLPQNSGGFYTELIQAFKLIDRDDDGVVSRGDLAALLSRLGPDPPSEEEVSLMLREVHGGRGDEGYISLEELASRVAETSVEGSVEMREVFQFFDADRNGKISAEELHRVFGVIGDERCTIEDCQRMIVTVDRNGDGFVCFEDFCRMMDE